MSERKSISEMGAELLREAGLLIAVFVPVDASIELQRGELRRWPWLGALFVSGLCFMIAGMRIERRRKQ